MLSGTAVKAPVLPFEEACRLAQIGVLGAGDIVWSRNTARADLALILEPDVALARAQQMGPMACVAVAETIGFLAPPQVGVAFRWPGTLLVNGATAGRIRLAAALGAEHEPPAWMVVGVTIDLVGAPRSAEPGHHPDETTLGDEGAGEITRTDVIEALAPRLLAWIHTWSEAGFRSIHDQWLFRADGREHDLVVDGVRGRVLGLDDEANLILKPATSVARLMAYRPHVLMLPAALAS
jgi:BirA family transcriptional regulator, biotin operon repressor / biotin---[acetyl-CoA-carboxylase] ligase